eukprot:1267548-Amphidinium_carterae.1
MARDEFWASGASTIRVSNVPRHRVSHTCVVGGCSAPLKSPQVRHSLPVHPKPPQVKPQA